MANSRRERIITVSGLKGYFPILPEEQKAFRIEMFFSATNVGETNYYSYEWYKERTVYGRFKAARGEYTTKEKLLQYQNELIYQEEATLNETVKRLQCQAQKQYEVNKFLVESIIKVAAAANVVTGFGAGGAAFDQIPPQPISIPALQVDGIYYNMFPGCAGNITVQTWYDDDICKDVNGNPLTRDNRGKPPDPASAGKPPAGTDRNVPPPTNSSGGSHVDDPLIPDVPTDTIDNPIPISGFAGTLYQVTYTVRDDYDGATSQGSFRIQGKYTSPVNREPNRQLYDYGFYAAIGTPGGGSTGVWQTLVYCGRSPSGAPARAVTSLSIVQL